MELHSPIESELDELIKEHCLAQPDICAKPDFVQLTDELFDLTKSLNEVKQLSQNTANDPEACKYILRIQKEKTKISKKLLDHFNS